MNPIDQRPTTIDVNLDAFGHNLNLIRKLAPGAEIMPVVKANGYGHGLVEVAQELERLKVDSLAVAFVEEGEMLRRAGCKLPILVLGGLIDSQLQKFIENDLELTASSIAKLESIDEVAGKLKRKARVHLKIDTGMERVGVHYYSSQPFIEKALAQKHCELVGVYTHVAVISADDTGSAKLQLERFLASIDHFRKVGAPMPKRHFASSASLLALPEGALDIVRPGLLTYGVAPWPVDKATWPYHQAMALRSKVVYFKVVKAGAGVSYGHTWHAPHDTRVVTIPIGYGDGYQRRLSNRGDVLVRGTRRRIVGNVCMDQLMVNLEDGEAFNGDEITLLGHQQGEFISVNELAELVDTTPHEILVALNARLPRRYFRNGLQVAA